MTLKDAALLYASWGWPVLPCHWIEARVCSCGDPGCRSPGKHPYSKLVPRGLHQASTDTRVVDAWWEAEPRANVAIRTGGPLLVVDVDEKTGAEGSETLREWERTHGALSETIECLTGGGGRHLYFALPAGMTIASGTNVLGPGVDVRAEGGYVLAPSSNHISGRTYEWELSNDPTDPDAEPVLAEAPPALLAALQTRASAASEPAPSTERLSSEKVSEIRAALAYIPADGRDTWLQVGMALESTRAGEQAYGLWTEWSQTSEKYDAKDQRRVWRSMRADHGITLSTLYWIAQGYGYVAMGPAAPPALAVEFVEAPDEEDGPKGHADEVMPPPAELLTVPGILAEFVAWSNRTAYRPQPQFSVQAALALGSLALGRAWMSDRRNWSALYFLNVGPSGSGKEHAKTCLDQVLYAAGHLGLVNGSGYTSRGAVYSSLRDRPCHLTVVDEFGMFLESTKAKGNAARADVVGDLMEAFGRVGGMMNSPSYSTMGLTPDQRAKVKPEPIWCPSITLLGLTTPRAFFGALTSESVRNGFLNRLLVVQSSHGRPAATDSPEIDPPAAVVEWVRAVRAPQGDLPVVDVGTLQPVPRVVPYSEGATEMARELDDYVLEWQSRIAPQGLDDLLTRVREITMRLALIVAVSRDPARPVVRPEAFGWARDYVCHYASQLVETVASHVADSQFDAMRLEILRGIRARGARGVSTREMARHAPFAKFSRRDRAQVLEALVEGGLISGQDIPAGPRGGRPSARWVAL